MTVPIGELRAELTADFGDFESAVAGVSASLTRIGREVAGVGPGVLDLEKRVTQLTQAWRTGTISEGEYSRGLRTLQADVREMAAATSTGTRDMERLAAVGSTVTGSLRQVTMHARRGADGFEAFGVATLAASNLATGGIRGVSAAANTLQVFALGNPVLIGILSGVAAIAMAWSMVRDRSDEAAVSAQTLQRVNLNAISGAAFTRWMKAADDAFAARGTEEFSRLNAEAQMWGRRYEDAVRNVRDLVRRGIHPSDMGGGAGGGTGGGTPGADQFTGPGLHAFSGNELLPTPEDFKPFENSMDGATERMREMKAAVKSLKPALMELGSTLNSAVVGGVQGLAVAFGNVLAGVGNFGDAIKKLLGGVLVSIGNALIAAGVGALKLFAALTSPFGAMAAIAAGFGLVALGTAMSASSQRGVSGSGGGGSGLSAPSATSGAIQSQGDLTIIFPSGSVIDPSDPRQQDAIMRMIEAGQGRNVLIRTGAA